MAKKVTSSVQNSNDPVPAFGSRYLTDHANVWTQNAWDHVPPPDDQDEIIASSLARQRLAPVPVEEQRKYNENPAKHWDNFYKMNSNNFFRDRHWLHNEFSELVDMTKPEAGPKIIAEIGCGAGNSVFPLLAGNLNPELVLLAYDYSSHAVKLVQNNPLFATPPAGSIRASVWDVTSDNLPQGVEPGTVDVIILVFVLSALHPNEWHRAIRNIYQMLRIGGLVVLRDYGRHDLTQLRFKSGRLLDDNLYIRGDKTRVYFFELDELSLLFTGARATSVVDNTTTQVCEPNDDEDESILNVDPADIPRKNKTNESDYVFCEIQHQGHRSLIHPSLLGATTDPTHTQFKAEQLGIDRRLLVNRKRQLKMYRVWMQGKFRKL